LETITQLQAAMQDVVRNLQIKEEEEIKKKSKEDEKTSDSNPPASASLS
jgi:hypothetical protein